MSHWHQHSSSAHARGRHCQRLAQTIEDALHGDDAYVKPMLT